MKRIKRSQKTTYVSLDLKKIFLTAPNTKREKITLIAVMVLVFMLYFGPLTFTQVSPIRAILISAIPTVTTSWAWIVFLRYIGRKADFCKKAPPGSNPSSY